LTGNIRPDCLLLSAALNAEQATCVAANTTSWSDLGRGKTILLVNGIDISNKSYT
jgi:hypothetical protein